jgi:hypothetical protein
MSQKNNRKPLPVARTPVNDRIVRYMDKWMGMTKPLEVEFENFILGHLVNLTARELRLHRRAIRRRIDAAIVGIDQSPAGALKSRDRAPFKAGALWALVNVRRQLASR